MGFSSLPRFRRSQSRNCLAVSIVAPEIANSTWFIMDTCVAGQEFVHIRILLCVHVFVSVAVPHFCLLRKIHRCTFVVRIQLRRPCVFLYRPPPLLWRPPLFPPRLLHRFIIASSPKAQFTFVSQLEATHSNASSPSKPANGSKTSRCCTGSCGVGKASKNSRSLRTFCTSCNAPRKLNASSVSCATRAHSEGNCWDHIIAISDSLCCVQLH